MALSMLPETAILLKNRRQLSSLSFTLFWKTLKVRRNSAYNFEESFGIEIQSGAPLETIQ